MAWLVVLNALVTSAPAEVDGVEAKGPNENRYLARPRGGLRPVAHLEHVGPPNTGITITFIFRRKN